MAKCYDSVERVLIFVNYEFLELTLPVWVQGTDHIDQTLRLQVGKAPNVPVHMAHNPIIGMNPGVLNEQFNRRLLHKTGYSYAQEPGEIRQKLCIMMEASSSPKRRIKLLALPVDLCSSGHFTSTKALVANSRRVSTLDSCEVPVSIAFR